MAVESGKPARLIPCLATLRYTVATVVTVLAVVVIVKVIAVGVRPDNVSASIVQGHVRTSDLWNDTSVDAETTVSAKAIYRPSRGARRPCIGGQGRPDIIPAPSRPCFGVGGGFGSYGLPTRTVYTPVEALTLEVSLSVDNLSGRGSISCRSINVTFLTGGNDTSMAGGRPVIGLLSLPNTFHFRLKPQTSHKISRLVTFNDTIALKHIADTYGGESSFTGKVEVTMNTSSDVLGHHNPFRIITLVCSQVDFSIFYAPATATSVQCAQESN